MSNLPTDPTPNPTSNPTPTNGPPASGSSSAARRPNSIVPGGWIILILLLVLVIGIVAFPSTPSVPYSPTFEKLAGAGQIKKLVIIGREKAIGEVRDKDAAILKELKLDLGGGQFTVNLPPSDDQRYRPMSGFSRR